MAESALTFLNLHGLQPFRQLPLELMKNLLLFVIQLGDAPQPDLSSFQSEQHDVHPVQLG